LIAELEKFSVLYRGELTAAMLNRLALKSCGQEADTALVNAAFRALADGGEALRWEPFFFDWFGGTASEARALAGPRAQLYGGEAFTALRELMAAYEPDRPERLRHTYFTAEDPQEMLINEIEEIWAAIADQDDWAPLYAKLTAVGQAAEAMQL